MNTATVKDNLLTPENEAKGETPDKFRDPETGEIRIDAVIESYKALEKKLSGMMPKPEGAEGRARVMKMMGCPDCADDYKIELGHELFTVDPEVNRRLHAQGLTNEQVQEVYNLAAEKLVPAIFELAQEYQAEREVERLIAAFGGAERWAEVSRQLLAFGQKNMPRDVLESLSSSFEGVMALYRMMKGGQGDTPLADAGAGDAGGADEGALRGMMRDPRYWRERDPSYVAQVTEGFRRVYGEG